MVTVVLLLACSPAEEPPAAAQPTTSRVITVQSPPPPDPIDCPRARIGRTRNSGLEIQEHLPPRPYFERFNGWLTPVKNGCLVISAGQQQIYTEEGAGPSKMRYRPHGGLFIQGDDRTPNRIDIFFSSLPRPIRIVDARGEGYEIILTLQSLANCSTADFDVGTRKFTQPSRATAGDIDGDGREDHVSSRWASATKDSWLDVCVGGRKLITRDMLGATAEAGTPLVDVEPDGKKEIFYGGTTISSAIFSVLVLQGGGLKIVRRTPGDPLYDEVYDELTVESGVGPPRRGFAIGCEDVDGDGARELIQVTVTKTGPGVARYIKDAYQLQGVRAKVIDRNRGTIDIVEARYEQAALTKTSQSLTQPCSPHLW